MRSPFPGLGPGVLDDPAFLEANESCQGLFAGLVSDSGEPAEGG